MIKISNNKKYISNEGYTLIETMIAISIFLFVIVFGITTLLNAFFVNQRSQNVRSVVDSLSYIMDDISRNIRIGYNYKCLEKGQDFPSQDDLGKPVSCREGYGIAFESGGGDVNTNDDQWVYFLFKGKIFRSTTGLINPIQITPNEVTINSDTSSFAVLGAESFTTSNDKQQPFVIIRLAGTIVDKNGVLPFSLQTSVSQRVLNN